MTKSTITREQLIKKAQEQIEFCRHTKITGEGRVHVNQCAALFEIALAAMDSEPVAEVLSNRPGNDTSTIDRALPVGTQLYRHAQQPVVPPMQHWEELCRQYPDMSIRDAIIRAAWWNHCRAAMLAAAPTGIPINSNGWIPVSERMPEMGEKQRYVLAADFKNNYWPNIPNTQVGVYGDWFDDGNPTWDDGDGEDLHLKEVTHWMPLPAAPQEVK